MLTLIERGNETTMMAGIGWNRELHDTLRWPRLVGQFGGEDKLVPGFDYAASFRLDAVAGACPGDGVEPISLYASSGVRPASDECGRRVL